MAFLDSLSQFAPDWMESIATSAMSALGIGSGPGGTTLDRYFGSSTPTYGFAEDPYQPVARGGSFSTPSFPSGGSMYSPVPSMPFSLAPSPARGLVPLNAGWPGPGYSPRLLPARKAQAGRSAGWYWKRPRRTNYLNPGALLRAERRMAGFSRWVKAHFSIQKSMPKRKHSRRAPSIRRRKK